MVGGAAPQVLAHSATTRVFEITDEIEVKDDLDKKPADDCDDSEKLSAEAARLYASIGLAKHGRTFVTGVVSDFFDHFVDDLRSNRQNRDRTFDLAFRIERVGESTSADGSIFEEVQITSRIRTDLRHGGADLSKAEFFAEELIPALENLSRAACDAYGKNCTPVDLSVSLDKREFTATVRFESPDENFANIFAKAHNLENQAEACSRSKSTLAIHNTKAYAENRAVAIITRLPRAGLDALLAKDAK